jgi:asparagine synthase (glutamine-hydrolysing)
MCGISGVVNFQGLHPEWKNRLHQINSAMPHRGPDADGFWFDEFVGLGHRRLSILDLSVSANQPMSQAEQKCHIVFNGEIFNFAEIRKELSGKYPFNTDHSDTEVILNAYLEWGIDCIHRFNGMFAIGLYDPILKKLFLVRDRIGKKPLHYFEHEGTLAFCSEINPLFASNVLKKEINEEAIYHYLTFLTTPAPNTFFKNIFKLEAGHYLTISSEGIEKKSYWNIADHLNNPEEISFEEAKAKTEDLLESSENLRLIADVPITSALSGGLDSALNLFYSSKVNPQISALTLSYEKTSKYDESVVAEKFAHERGVDFHHHVVTDQLFESLITDYIEIQEDVPMGDPNTALVYHLGQLARKMQCKVLMVGEGGDELGGYPNYLRMESRNRWLKLVPKWIQPIFSTLPLRWAKQLDVFYEGSIISQSHILGFPESVVQRNWLGTKKHSSYSVLAKFQKEIKTNSADQFLREVSNVEYKLRLPELILPRIDYPTMAASVEARSPMVDYRLVEASAKWSFHLRMQHGKTKALFRALAKNKLPDYLLNAPKVGFGMLLTPFLNDTLPQWYQQSVLEKGAPIQKYVSYSFLAQIHQDQLKNQRNGFYLWILYALDQWLRKHQANG